MENFTVERIKKAYPSDPVKIIGLNSVPDFGDSVFSFLSEKDAKNFILNLKKKQTIKSLVSPQIQTARSDIKKLNVIIKADVAGSLKAILDAVKNIKSKDGEIFIIDAGVGGISESDILTAEAAKAVILGFRVKPAPASLKLAEQRKIKILSFDVIYNLIDNLKKLFIEAIGPIITKTEIGQAKVLALFRKEKEYKIVGVKVTQGKFILNSQVEIFHGESEVGAGKIISLKIQQQNMKEIGADTECGIGIETAAEIEKDDSLHCFTIEEKKPEIE